jgi:hypothetical protein
MEKKYYHVQDGAINKGPVACPKAWKNISGFHHMTDAEKAPYGWLPERIVGNDTLLENQVKTGPVKSVGADEVVATYTITTKTAQEIDDERAAAAEASVASDIVESIIEWAAPLFGKTKEDARSEIKAKIKARK